MKNQIKLAVASALLTVTASANAGIIIPAGDWTLDIGGVISAFYTQTHIPASSVAGAERNNITSGFLPNTLSFSGKTRQNDLDVGFRIAINPGISTSQALDQAAHQENRQAYMTIGDASWGSVKLGKDIGIFASDAMLNDMTLIGVGHGAAGTNGTSTLGQSGTGYIYPDWKSQIAYTSPNWSGFSFTAGVTQAWNTTGGDVSARSTTRGGAQPAFEGKASYAWAGDVAGKVWVSGFTQKIENLTDALLVSQGSGRAKGFDVGANLNVAGFGLTGYYYDGKGIGLGGLLSQGFYQDGEARDSYGGYTQLTYTLPKLGTKIGTSWGVSYLPRASAEAISNAFDKLQMQTYGIYHPLTKNVNLVAEYSKYDKERVSHIDARREQTYSLGAILFF